MAQRYPKDIQVRIQGTCEYVTLHDKRDFADVLRFLKWGDYFVLSRLAQQGKMTLKCGRGRQNHQCLSI